MRVGADWSGSRTKATRMSNWRATSCAMIACRGSPAASPVFANRSCAAPAGRPKRPICSTFLPPATTSAAPTNRGASALTALQALGEARGKNLLRYWLRRHGVRPPDARKLAEMLRQVVSAAAGARIDFAVGRLGDPPLPLVDCRDADRYGCRTPAGLLERCHPCRMGTARHRFRKRVWRRHFQWLRCGVARPRSARGAVESVCGCKRAGRAAA